MQVRGITKSNTIMDYKLSHPNIVTLMTTNVDIYQYIDNVYRPTINEGLSPARLDVFIPEPDDDPIYEGVMKELTSTPFAEHMSVYRALPDHLTKEYPTFRPILGRHNPDGYFIVTGKEQPDVDIHNMNIHHDNVLIKYAGKIA